MESPSRVLFNRSDALGNLFSAHFIAPNEELQTTLGSPSGRLQQFQDQAAQSALTVPATAVETTRDDGLQFERRTEGRYIS